MERLLRIESLVHGGDGLARDGGQVVFVPLVAPGDLVRVRVAPAKGGAVRAELLEVVEPGPSRVEPPCALAGTCGGCDWQQVSPAAQLGAKAASVREALARIGGFAEPPVRAAVASPRAFRYRRRLRAHLTREGWGFSRRASNTLVDVPACLIVEEAVEALAHEVARGVREVGLGGVKSFGVDVLETGAGAVHVELARAPGASERGRAERLLAKVERLRGVVLTAEGATPVVLGQPVLVDEGHRRLRVRPDLFAQANRLGARLLADAAAASVAPGASVLELYAGSGTLSLPIAARAGRLVATEGEGPALDLLRASLAENRRDARLVSGPAKRVVDGLAAEGQRFDHVVLDPPRTGAKDVMPAIARLAPARITYVSCDPATFARDAASLARAGWVLDEVTPFDLFPHTHHVELVAVLSRRGDRA